MAPPPLSLPVLSIMTSFLITTIKHQHSFSLHPNIKDIVMELATRFPLLLLLLYCLFNPHHNVTPSSSKYKNNKKWVR